MSLGVASTAPNKPPMPELRVTFRCAVLAVLSLSAHAAEPDELLAALTAETVAARPELAQAMADVRAARERVPQAESWSDPMFQFGVQNDSFTKWQVGKMETSWVLFMASQTIPFPGKPGLRGEIANVEVTQQELALERARLTAIAEVRRAYLLLQLSRARLALLSKLTGLVAQAVEAAQSRYETGDGPQSDILRARLELARLDQQRLLAEANEALPRQAINRLRGHPLDENVATRALTQLTFPTPPDESEATAHVLKTNPEYLAVRAGIRGAERTRDLNRRQYLPDFSVGAGVMARGSLDPMWTVTIGVPLPVFAATKQSRAVAEAEAMLTSTQRSADALEQILRLRTAQRLAYWRTLSAVWRSYQERLLAEAEAVAASTLTQYRIGKVPFASVLEATSATIELTDASYSVLGDGWMLAIAQDESSLAEVTAGSASMTGAIPGSKGAMTSPTASSRSSGMASQGSANPPAEGGM